jgi:hypothetical protein
MFKRKKAPAGNIRKRARSDASDDTEVGIETDGAPVVVKPAASSSKHNPLIQGVAKKERIEVPSDTYDSSRTAASLVPRDMGATSELNVDTEQDRDARAIEERALELQRELADQDEDNIYRGMSGYTNYIPKGDTSGRIKYVLCRS